MNVQGVPIQIEDFFFTNQRREKERRMVKVVAKRLTLWKKNIKTSLSPSIRREMEGQSPHHHQDLG